MRKTELGSIHSSFTTGRFCFVFFLPYHAGKNKIHFNSLESDLFNAFFFLQQICKEASKLYFV